MKLILIATLLVLMGCASTVKQKRYHQEFSVVAQHDGQHPTVVAVFKISN